MGREWLPSTLSGLVGLLTRTTAERAVIIEQGIAQIARQMRNPMTGAYNFDGPVEGVAIVGNELALDVFLESVVAVSVRDRRWERHRFYYPCLAVSLITHTRTWGTLNKALARENIEPVLVCEKDIHVFHDADWLLCEVRLCLA